MCLVFQPNLCLVGWIHAHKQARSCKCIPQEGYKNAANLSERKLERPKPNSNFIQLLPQKITQKVSFIHIFTSKSGPRRIYLHSLLDVGWNFTSNGEEKAEVFCAFFASVLHSQTSCSQDAQASEMEDRGREPNEAKGE